MKQTRRYRRRRGVYVSPLLVVVVLLAAAGAAFWLLSGRGAEKPAQPGDSQQQVQPEAPGDTPPAGGGEESPSQPPANAVSAAGVACTLTELGEEALYTGELILVNNWTAYHFPEEQPLSNIYAEKTGSYYVRDTTVFLAPAAMAALNDLMDDFRAQGGSKTVNVVAGYRTAEEQQHLFDQSAERNGLAHAEKFVAKPGGSEHHTGYAVDLHIRHEDGTSEEYTGAGEYAWINKNCQDYGFVVRYDQAKAELTGIDNEPWHFRYVGIPHATKMAEEDLCLEEYVAYLKQYTFDQPLTIDCAAGTYAVWYTVGTAAYLPDSGAYTLSGNNVDGVVVTVKTGD